MTINENTAKSILTKHKRIDSWFLSRYGMNLYRGCSHNCAYCDGRAESYYVEGDFGKDITVKINAPELLRKALDPKRKRKPLKKTFIGIGGGVSDSYQPLEKKYELTRQALEIIAEFKFPVHVLTKSSLVERDFDVLKQINQDSAVILSVSISSGEDRKSALFEPGASPVSSRLATIRKAKELGFFTGVYLLPVIPFVTDGPQEIGEAVRKAKEAGADFVMFGGMTLKAGRQRDHFMNILGGRFPEILKAYGNIYGDDRWGSAIGDYYAAIEQSFALAAKRFRAARRIPTHVFQNVLDDNDRVVVTLENIDYFQGEQGRRSKFRVAAHSIAMCQDPLSTLRSNLRNLPGVDAEIEEIIIEILDKGVSHRHESLF